MQETRALSLMLCADTSPVLALGEIPPDVDAVFSRIRAADYALADVEIPLTLRGQPVQKLLNIRAHPDRARDVARMGIRLATLANNHAVDYGWDGLQDTMAALQAAGVATTGAGENSTQAEALHLSEVGGVRIGTLALSCLTPTGMSAAADRAGIAALHVRTAYEVDPWYQMEEPGDPSVVRVRTSLHDHELAMLRDRVRRASRSCDLLIATVHWGFGSTELLADYQPVLAHFLIDEGVHLVHGHHPHALQPLELYKGRHIVYSANVLVGQQVFLDASAQVHSLWAAMSPNGFLTHVLMHQDGNCKVRLLPTRLGEDRLPRFLEAAEVQRIADHLSAISVRFGTRMMVVNNQIEVLPLA
jgi:poly-gamma-glutamate capsule biosynthesis protein CapA/YwtB (metallophosphatase superfamily)